jgi:D-lactate dehydrogenase
MLNLLELKKIFLNWRKHNLIFLPTKMIPQNNFSQFLNQIRRFLPKNNILQDTLSLHAYAHDASHYLLIPKLVLIIDNEYEVQNILASAKEFNIPITIRAAGSSLSGQSITDSVLLVISWKWRKYKIHDNGDVIQLQAGVIGKDANYYLSKYKKKIGPDPSSIDFAKIGGIAANNSSGMCCGVKDNSYHTLKNMRIIFSDGSLLDTSNETSVQEFKSNHSDWMNKILAIKKEILLNENLVNKIRKKYSIKNTVGYSLNAFLDFEDPIQIISHLMVGSEGTLGFISEITYKTIYDEPLKKASLCFFSDLRSAMEAVLILKNDKISSLEFLDSVSLNCAKKELEEFLPSKFNASSTTALIIDIRESNELDLDKTISDLIEIIHKCNGILFSSNFYDGEKYNKIMKIRKSILPIVQAQRSPKSVALLEDIAFPLESLPQATHDLKQLFLSHGFHGACLFGHAKDGNLHFLIEMKFESENDTKRYENFMSDLAFLVVEKYNGSLKAEHGTGRNIAPFVEMEWGKDACKMMYEIKSILDPEFILNPDVILSSDKSVHLKNLKKVPEINHDFDKCNECGACERICPSYGLSLTPRQRIVSLRTMETLKNNVGKKIYRIMFKRFKYYGSDTCAASGMCAVVCPVGIDTGKVIKDWRAMHASKISNIFWNIASYFHRFINLIAKFYIKIRGFFYA